MRRKDHEEHRSNTIDSDAILNGAAEKGVGGQQKARSDFPLVGDPFTEACPTSLRLGPGVPLQFPRRVQLSTLRPPPTVSMVVLMASRCQLNTSDHSQCRSGCLTTSLGLKESMTKRNVRIDPPLSISPLADVFKLLFLRLFPTPRTMTWLR